MSSKLQILCTRPLGAALVEKALSHDIYIDEIPFIRIEPIVDSKLEDKIRDLWTQSIHVVFTSSNAVTEVARYATTSTASIYCIGKVTNKVVSECFGEQQIIGTAMNAIELAEIIKKDKVQRIVFFCGDHRRDELPDSLRDYGIEVEEVMVYRTILTPHVIDKKYDGILFFSPSGVESFFSINTLGAGTSIFAVGETTAKAIKKFNQAGVILAGKPGKIDMVEQLIQYFRGPTSGTCKN